MDYIIQFDLVIITIVAMILDIITGFASALKNADLSSSKMRQGLWHKAGFCGLLILAYMVQFAMAHMELGLDFPAVDAVCVWIVVTEIVSIIENLCIINPAIMDSPVGKLFRLSEDVLKEEVKELQAKETVKEVERAIEQEHKPATGNE